MSPRGSASIPLASLSVALEHPLVAEDAKVLCAAARVCRAWRHAVQQCGACELAVVLGPNARVLQLCSFAAWLPRHAALVKAFTFKAGHGWMFAAIDGFKRKQYMAVALQLLLPAVQLAGLLPAAASLKVTPAAAADGATSSTPQQQQLRHLRLSSFSSHLEAAGMLAAMPAHSLTALGLEPAYSFGAGGPSPAALLARFSNLQQLRLVGEYSIQMPGSCLAGVAQLTQLTALTLEGRWAQVGKPLQQLLLQRLQLRRLSLLLVQSLPVLKMTVLTQLEELTFGYAKLASGSTLPAGLQRLSLHGSTDLSSVLALQQLQHLSLNARLIDWTQLVRVAQLPALQHVSLQYDGPASAAASAPAWQHLPQLRELNLAYEHAPPTAQQMAAILAGAAAATMLTKLNIEARAEADEEDEEEFEEEQVVVEVAACASLAGLTQLRDLTFDASSRLVPGDAMALTALSALTCLGLPHAGSAVDDVVASALACSLKQLRSLDLSGCELGSMACLAPIAHLSQLTKLQLNAVEGLTKRGLMMLTRLKALQELAVQHNEEVTPQVLEEFWVAVRQRTLATA